MRMGRAARGPKKTNMLTRQCKTCGRPVNPGDVRCPEHEAACRAYLQADGEQDRPDVYQPRRNGVHFAGPIVGLARRGLRRPRPGEELNFDED